MPGDLIMRVQERLNELVDEETTRKYGELNIVLEVTEPSSGTVRIRYSPLSPYSPIAVNTGRLIRGAALSVDGVNRATVECTGHMLDDLVNRLVNKEERRKPF